MSMTRDEFDKRFRSHQMGGDLEQQISQLQILKQAKVHASSLTGHEAWDLFLSYIQGVTEYYRQHLNTATDLLLSDKAVSYDDIVRLKMQIARYQEAINVLNAVICTPRLLKEMGDKAESIIDRIREQDVIND